MIVYRKPRPAIVSAFSFVAVRLQEGFVQLGELFSTVLHLVVESIRHFFYARHNIIIVVPLNVFLLPAVLGK